METRRSPNSCGFYRAETPQVGRSMYQWALEGTSEGNLSEGVASSPSRMVGISCTRQGDRRLGFEQGW